MQLHELCLHQLLYAGPLVDVMEEASPDEVLRVVARVQPLRFTELEVFDPL